jgi:1-aminocyclopropane-1-carboxylate deaminase/D-cysteine desulfhydrase-like pyridoxal-dependent ACC family enzyme
VYGAKALYGVSALLQAGTISPTDRLLYIHTGGMGPV